MAGGPGARAGGGARGGPVTAIGPVGPAGVGGALPSGLTVAVRVPMQQVVAQVAGALGLTAAEVSRQLAGGASLAQLAAARGVSVAELIRVLGRAVLLAQGTSAAVGWNAVVLERALAAMVQQRQVGTMVGWDVRAGWVAAAQLPVPGALGTRFRPDRDPRRSPHPDGEPEAGDPGTDAEGAAGEGTGAGDAGDAPLDDPVARTAARGYHEHPDRRGRHLDVRT